MKKRNALFLMLFLSACVQAPKDIFQENLNLGKIEILPVNKIEVISYQKHFDSKHHIENQWPLAPQEIIQKWATTTLKTTQDETKNLIIEIHQSEVNREELTAQKWYQKDEVKDTLSYRVDFVFKEGDKTKYTYHVQGKAFAQMPEKLSRSDKEKEWVQMANQMLASLQTELVQKGDHVL